MNDQTPIRRKATDEASFDEAEAAGYDGTLRSWDSPETITLGMVHQATRSHRAYEADYCPLCGTARSI